VRKQQRILEILLVFAAFFLPGYAGQGSLRLAAGVDLAPLMLQSILTGVPQLLLMVYIVSIQSDWSPARWGMVRLRPLDAARVAVLAAACFVMAVLLASLPRVLPPNWEPVLLRGFRWSLRGPAQLPLAAGFGLAAGYREEFFFRSYLLGRLDEAGLPRGAAVALSTAVFAAGHLYEGALGLLITGAIGLVLALAYTRQRNLHVVALAHGLYNVLSLAAGLLAPIGRGPLVG
jgi:uncharacterized protein